MTLKQKVAVFVIVGCVLTAASAVGTVFGIKKHKAATAKPGTLEEALPQAPAEPVKSVKRSTAKKSTASATKKAN